MFRFTRQMAVGSTALCVMTSLCAAPAAAAAIPGSRIALVNDQLAGYLQSRTKVPILLPQYLPPSLSGTATHLTAQATANAGQYSVQYWMTVHPQGINGSPASLTANPADTQVFSLQGRRFASPRVAVSALAQAVSPWYRAPAGSRVMEPLIPGFDAAYYPAVHTLVWREGDWTIEIHQGSLASDLSEGRLVDASLATYALPPFPGILVTAPAPHSPSAAYYGEAYALAFADGASVYRVNPFYVQPAASASPSPAALDSPDNLAAAANSLVPLAAFYTSTAAGLTLRADPQTIRVGGHAMISGQVQKANGHGDPYSSFSMYGLPQTQSFLDGTTNQNGQFSLRFVFPHVGTYTVEASTGNINRTVRIRVLPVAPSFGSAVVASALQDIAGHAHLPLAGPSVLPVRSTGYLAARAFVQPSDYAVTVLQTTRPLAVNSPQIAHYTAPNAVVAQFGGIRLPIAQPAPGAPDYLSLLAAHNPVMARFPASTATAYPDLGLGIHGAVYRHGQSTVLDWEEGDWTVTISGGALAQEKQAAIPIVAYLHRNFLPPYPGIFAVQLTGGANQARTEIDWMNGHVLSYVNNPTPAANNPVAAASMAVSWRLFQP